MESGTSMGIGLVRSYVGKAGADVGVAPVTHPGDVPPLWWYAPFFDGSSFGLEAAELLAGLLEGGYAAPTTTRIGKLQVCGQSWSTH
jgi:hypothetical protein